MSHIKLLKNFCGKFQSRVSLIDGSFGAGFTRGRRALATNPGGFIANAMMVNDHQKLKNILVLHFFENIRRIEDTS